MSDPAQPERPPADPSGPATGSLTYSTPTDDDPTVWLTCSHCGRHGAVTEPRCPACSAPWSSAEPVAIDEQTRPMPAVPADQPTATVTPAPLTASDLIANLVRDTRVARAVEDPGPDAVPDTRVAPAQVPDTRVSPAPAPAPDTRVGAVPQVSAPRQTMPPPPPGQGGAQYPNPAPAPNPAPMPPARPPLQPPGPMPVRDALPLPERTERPPAQLIAVGVAIGLVLLLLGGGAISLLNRDRSGATTANAAPAGTPTTVASGTVTAAASSTQDPEGGITYSAENTLDGRPETAWNSNGKKDGKGPGMVLTYRFADLVNLTSVTVLNGYQKTTTPAGKPPTDLFALNGRVRGVRVVTDTGTWTWELADARTPQTLTKAFGRTSSVRFEVLSVYPGAKYLDLAVSEVSFTATP